ncbi:protein tweety-like isoform X3 [Brevipalpus obovatus]|uniref:protein tweety-like isoform X3 n=1 Tax=Brevipalpus obovatus TaxID=246614 RepID=UPI003D9E80D4
MFDLPPEVKDVMNRIDSLNLTAESPGGNFNMSILAIYFHQIPHKDIHLNWVNSTFDLKDDQYQEALGIIVAVPGFWLILTLLFFLIFFLSRCCDVNSKKKKKLTCCKCCLCLFTVISVAVIAVGMYGNFKTHQGMIKVQNSSSHIAQNIEELHRLTSQIDNGIVKDIHDNLNLSLNRATGPIIKEYSLVQVIADNVSEMRKECNSANSLIASIKSRIIDRTNFAQIDRLNLPEKEMIRTIFTWAMLASLLFVGMILICGICKHSRCLLILFSVLGLLSLVICWVLASIYIGFCVAVSDLCINPKPFVYKYLPRENPQLNYYLECDEQTTNIYAKEIEQILTHMEKIKQGYDKIQSDCKNKCTDLQFVQIMENVGKNYFTIHDKITSFKDKSNCQMVHQNFESTLGYTCKDVLEGVTLMLLSAAVTGLIFTLLVLCASHTWINIRYKRNKAMTGENNDETDPFLPPVSTSSTVSSSASNIKRASNNHPDIGGSSMRPSRYSHTPPQTPHFVPVPGYMANAPQLPTSSNVGQHGHPMHQPHHHPGLASVGPQYVGDIEMMRATQATKF